MLINVAVSLEKTNIVNVLSFSSVFHYIYCEAFGILILGGGKEMSGLLTLTRQVISSELFT